MSKVINFEMNLPFITDIDLVAIGAIQKTAEFLNIEERKVATVNKIVAETIDKAFKHSVRKPNNIKIKFNITKEKISIFVDKDKQIINLEII